MSGDFAEEWIAAWNAHDLERILSHYSDDIVFCSPVAERLTGAGRVEGKAALRAYWGTAFQRSADLHFTLTKIYRGADTLTLAYDNQRGHAVSETFLFGADGKVVFAAACYAEV